MKKLALFVTAAALCGSAVFATDIADILKTKKELRFNADGTFRVLVLGDVQSSAVPLQESVQANIRTLVDREKPDLVLFPGDNSIRMNSEEKLRTYLKSMVGYIEQKQIPWHRRDCRQRIRHREDIVLRPMKSHRAVFA